MLQLPVLNSGLNILPIANVPAFPTHVPVMGYNAICYTNQVVATSPCATTLVQGCCFTQNTLAQKHQELERRELEARVERAEAEALKEKINAQIMLHEACCGPCRCCCCMQTCIVPTVQYVAVPQVVKCSHQHAPQPSPTQQTHQVQNDQENQKVI
jgi:hypothetical protein